MCEVIAISNQKGGVGKTTTAVNLAASLALAEKNTLLIDFDPQANATTSLGFLRGDVEFDIYHALIGTKEMRDVIHETDMPYLHIAPSNIGLVGIEKEFYDKTRKSREMLLRKVISQVQDNYDYVIIDSPPALGPLTINALCAAKSVIIPIQCEFFALEGLAQLINTIRLLQNSKNPGLKIKGLLPTMYSSQNNLSKQVLIDLSNHFNSSLFKKTGSSDEYVVIPRSIKLAESPSFGKPILLYDIKSNGAMAYQTLANTIIQERA